MHMAGDTSFRGREVRRTSMTSLVTSGTQYAVNVERCIPLAYYEPGYTA